MAKNVNLIRMPVFDGIQIHVHEIRGFPLRSSSCPAQRNRVGVSAVSYWFWCRCSKAHASSHAVGVGFEGDSHLLEG